MTEQILLLEPAIAMGKFKLMCWLAAIGCVLAYAGGRIAEARAGRKRLSSAKVILIVMIVPVWLVWYGYHTQLNRFYQISLKDNGQLLLHFVYPETKQVLLESGAASISRFSHTQCQLVITASPDIFKSVPTLNHDACKLAKARVNAL